MLLGTPRLDPRVTRAPITVRPLPWAVGPAGVAVPAIPPPATPTQSGVILGMQAHVSVNHSQPEPRGRPCDKRRSPGRSAPRTPDACAGMNLGARKPQCAGWGQVHPRRCATPLQRLRQACCAAGPPRDQAGEPDLVEKAVGWLFGSKALADPVRRLPSVPGTTTRPRPAATL
jgi:hypothetical protein